MLLRPPFALVPGIVLALALCATAQVAQSDHILLAAEHVQANTRSAGLAGAGVAIAEGIASAQYNPAALHSYNVINNTTVTAALSYASGEPTFSRHGLSAGIGTCVTDILSCGLLYRYLRPESEDNQINQILLNVSGRLFDRSISHGIVNLGINVRYEKLAWAPRGFDTLFTTRTIDTATARDTFSLWNNAGELERRRLAFDLGFYQDNVGEGLDFGLTLHNLVGYTWTKERPTARHSRWDSLAISLTALNDSDTVMTVDSNYYVDERSEYNNWILGHNRRVSVGFAFHKEVLEDKALIYLPFDFEIFNLFDLDEHTRLAFRTGLEVWIKDKYCLRFGYARAPEVYPADPGDIENANIFSGGAGVRLSSFGVDLYIRRSAWGLGGTFAL